MRAAGRVVIAALYEELRLLPHVIGYELRKATAFRAGFVFQQLLRGVPRSAVMAIVYLAMFRSTGAHTIAGYSFRDLVAYLVWAAILGKCLSDERTLDIAEQIFDGYITKYLVMPVHFFTLAWGRALQFTLLQLGFAVLLFSLGALFVPSYWPGPASFPALLQATCLLLLGAGCYFLVQLTLCFLAFWLDVVWSLTNMFQFVSYFVSGALLPLSLMPKGVQTVLACTFPYWTVFAPTQILLGRAGTPDFLQGALVLLAWLLVLQVIASLTWSRGVAHYTGVGA